MLHSSPDPTGASSIAGILVQRAARTPDKPVFVLLGDGSEQTDCLTFAGLDLRARTIAHRLAQQGCRQRPVLLCYPPGLDFITALFGCLYAGAIAVPVPLSHRGTAGERTAAILASTASRCVLTAAEFLPALVHSLPETIAGHSYDVLSTNPLWTNDSGGGQIATVREADIAVLHFTSGSTGTPRGIAITHRNVLANEAMIQRAMRLDEDSRLVSWLPHYHDMGLIGDILQPVYSGFTCYRLSPLAFLQRPHRWLAALSRYRATISGGPNFAYDLCVRRVTAEQWRELDLSHLEVLYFGAEPVRPRTIEAFLSAAAPTGLRPGAVFPCYGLAEATLFVSGGPPGRPSRCLTLNGAALAEGRLEEADAMDARARKLVSCGSVAEGSEVIVLDPASSAALPTGQIGEVCVRGPHISPGYWDDTVGLSEAVSESPEDANALLRTGDLGFSHSGELFITGRLKDVVIIHGRNHYPQDLEESARSAHAALAGGLGAAFSVDTGLREDAIIAHEVERGASGALSADICAAIRHALLTEHGIQPAQVILVRQGTLPRTSSGKIRRRQCADDYLSGALRVVHSDSPLPIAR